MRTGPTTIGLLLAVLLSAMGARAQTVGGVEAGGAETPTVGTTQTVATGIDAASKQPDAAQADANQSGATLGDATRADAVSPAARSAPTAAAPPDQAVDRAPAVADQATEQTVAPPSPEPVRQASPAPASAVPPPPSQSGSSSVSEAPPRDVVVAPIGPEIVQRAQAMAGRSVNAADLAALKAHFGAHPDKPLWIEGRGLSSRAKAVMRELAAADQWGLRAGDYRLPGPEAGPDRDTLTEAEARLTLAVLAYARHARGGRYDPKQLSIDIDRTPPLKAPEAVLSEIAASDNPETYLRKLHPRHPQFERLRKLYVALKAGASITPEGPPEPDVASQTVRKSTKARRKAPASRQTVSAERVLMNMEQWRWMPEDLGQLHIVANIPEFLVRVVKAGEVIHTERMIAGEVDKQTPLFSQDMQSVVFHPGWGVPNSIKVKELLPGLLRGRDTLSRNGLRATYKGRPVDPTSIDWSTTDIRNLAVIQPPGAGNVLGVVKFQFPNKHDIYMHDTPTKHLFNSSVRTFSHGCMRIRNPVKLAEIVFRETAGWSPARVAGLIKGGPMDNRVMLQKRIPVHMTSFTITVDEQGKASAFADVYGHEKRIRMALDGKAHLIPKKVVNLSAARAEVLNNVGAAQSFRRRNDDWVNGVFPGMN